MSEHKYLCYAYGESELPRAAIVGDRDGLRAFLVREWFGRDDDPDLPVALDRFDANDWRDEPKMEWEFEIGGVSIERLFESREPIATPQAAAVESAEGGSALRWTWEQRGDSHFYTVPSVEYWVAFSVDENSGEVWHAYRGPADQDGELSEEIGMFRSEHEAKAACVREATQAPDPCAGKGELSALVPLEPTPTMRAAGREVLKSRAFHVHDAVCQVYRAMIACRPPAAAPVTWQPIDSAPINNTRIIAELDGDVCIAWWTDSSFWRSKPGCIERIYPKRWTPMPSERLVPQDARL